MIDLAGYSIVILAVIGIVLYLYYRDYVDLKRRYNEVSYNNIKIKEYSKSLVNFLDIISKDKDVFRQNLIKFHDSQLFLFGYNYASRMLLKELSFIGTYAKGIIENDPGKRLTEIPGHPGIILLCEKDLNNYLSDHCIVIICVLHEKKHKIRNRLMVDFGNKVEIYFLDELISREG